MNLVETQVFNIRMSRICFAAIDESQHFLSVGKKYSFYIEASRHTFPPNSIELIDFFHACLYYKYPEYSFHLYMALSPRDRDVVLISAHKEFECSLTEYLKKPHSPKRASKETVLKEMADVLSFSKESNMKKPSFGGVVLITFSLTVRHGLNEVSFLPFIFPHPALPTDKAILRRTKA